MIKAPTLRLCFALLAAATFGAAAQTAPTEAAIDEAVRRQAETIVLRGKLVEAQGAEARKDLAGAAKLYEDAYALVQRIGAGIEAETEQTVRGLSAIRMTLAREAAKRGDLDEANVQVTRVLKVNPKDAEALAFKQANDKILAAQYPNRPNDATLERKAPTEKERVEAAKLVQDGKLLWELGKLNEAETKLNQALIMDPANQAAPYYLNLVKDMLYRQAIRKREGNSKNALLHVEQAWETEAKREMLPTPNLYARTNLVYVGKGRQAIISKLDRIRLDTLMYDGLPLSEVVRDLSEKAKQRDPDKRGINFIVNQEVAPVTQQLSAPQIDPTTGLPMPNFQGPQEQVDVTSIAIKLNPQVTDIRLADALEAIVRTAERGIKYSIEEYAVVFSLKGQEIVPLATRTFKVDPNTFSQGLQNVGTFQFGSTGGSQGGGGSRGGGGGSRGGGGGSRGSSGGGGQESYGADIARVSPAGGGGGGGGGRNGQGGGTTGGGLAFVTSTNSTDFVSALARDYFSVLGVNLDPALGKSVFFNDRQGLLLVRATTDELDTIQAAIQVLNVQPDQVNIKAKFIEVSQNDNKALGFDYYLGNVQMAGGRIGGQAGTAPSFNGSDPNGLTGPSTVFPGSLSRTLTDGTVTPSTTITPSSSDQLLTKGLRNSSDSLFTLTGILTDPQFRWVIHALEQRDGTEILSAPEVTTLSGRQAQMKATEVKTVITEFDSDQLNQGGGGTGTGGF